MSSSDEEWDDADWDSQDEDAPVASLLDAGGRLVPSAADAWAELRDATGFDYASWRAASGACLALALGPLRDARVCVCVWWWWGAHRAVGDCTRHSPI